MGVGVWVCGCVCVCVCIKFDHHMRTHTLGPPPPEDEDEEALGPDGTSGRSRLRSNYCGIEVVSKLKIGTRVRRGPDWKWGEQVRAMSVIHCV